jgi:hypothetical protein
MRLMTYESTSTATASRLSAHGARPPIHYRGRSAASAAPDNPSSTRSTDTAYCPHVGRWQLYPSNGHGQRPDFRSIEHVVAYAGLLSQSAGRQWDINELMIACNLIECSYVGDKLLNTMAIVSKIRLLCTAKTCKNAVADNGAERHKARDQHATPATSWSLSFHLLAKSPRHPPHPPHLYDATATLARKAPTISVCKCFQTVLTVFISI